MLQKNKFLAILIAFLFTFQISYANNKQDLLSSITTLENNLGTLKTNSQKNLETKALELAKSFDDSFTSLGYDTKTIDYLVSLGKITSNFKNDLTLEVNNLHKEIGDKTLIEINSLSAIKNNINFNYTTVSDSEKISLNNSITAVQANYTNLSQSFSEKINTLHTKYSTAVTAYKNNLKEVYNSNTGTLAILDTFSKNYEILFTKNAEFEKNFEAFKSSYLAFAGDLTVFSTEKQKYYVDSLKKELEKIRDANIEANKQLEPYKLDIERLIDILLENFKNALFIKMENSYGVIYSDTDINSLISRYNTAKNRYYDLDGKLKANEVLTQTGATEEVVFLINKISEVNTKISTLLGNGETSNSLENVKIRLENEMVRFYNANYEGYRQDLLVKIKEKLNIVALEAKNTIIGADFIDLKYSLLNDKISKSNDIVYINNQIADFKKDIVKYTYLNSDILNRKIATLEYNLGIFVVKKELGQFKYNKMSQTKYDTQLKVIFEKLKVKFPDTHKQKLNIVLNRIDTLLQNQKLSDKKRFMLLVVKLNILNYNNN